MLDKNSNFYKTSAIYEWQGQGVTPLWQEFMQLVCKRPVLIFISAILDTSQGYLLVFMKHNETMTKLYQSLAIFFQPNQRKRVFSTGLQITGPSFIYAKQNYSLRTVVFEGMVFCHFLLRFLISFSWNTEFLEKFLTNFY